MATDAPDTQSQNPQSQSRGNLHLYPGWMARCQKCDYEADLESLGWVRKGAYSYGKRSMVYCPTCERNCMMQIIHVDENGEPDQSLKKVLTVVLGIQLIVWSILGTALYFVFGGMF